MRRIVQLVTVLWMGLACLHASAQNTAITGRVTSADDGSALPGVSVLEKGTTNGTTTDAQGNYRISVGAGATLVFSFVGNVSQEIAVGNRTSVNVQLSPDVKSLNEVVVVGYGTQVRQELTGNIASIGGKEIENIAVPSLEAAMQGRAAGVFVESQNGKVGQGMKIRVRGSSSVSAGNQPLYVVDGIPITSQSQSTNGAETNPLADINFNDIESVEVLKDASAAAIYGSRASNGVVLITTKRGKAGRTNFNVGYFTGFSTPTRRREFLNARQFVDMTLDAAVRAGKYDFREDISGYGTEEEAIDDYVSFAESRLTRYSAGNEDWRNATVDTDWQDQVFRRAQISQYDVSAAGGTEKTRFYVGGQYTDQNGILIGNRFRRYSGRVNLDHQATGRIAFGVNFSLARSENDRLSNDNAFSTPLQIVALSPITPVIDPRSGLISGTLPGPASNYPVYYNPMISLGNTFYKTTVYRTISNLYGSWTITPGLTFRSEFGIDLLNQTENAYYGRLTFRNTGTPNGQGYNTNTAIFNYTANNFLRYEKTLADRHAFDVVAGISYQESSDNSSSITAQQFPSDAYKQIASAAVYSAASTTLNNFSFLSYFARANYKFANKYLVNLSGRLDGSSRFGANTRYGFFPAASVGWILSEESFLKDFSPVSLLKARVSYGLTGNAEIGNFPSRGLFSASNIGINLINASYVGIPGQAPSQLANPDLKWETTAQLDFGIDFGFFNNRISGQLDYYVKKTKDLLLDVNVPATTGFTTQTRNVGRLENRGVEVVLSTQNTTGAFEWSTNLNFAANQNKITDLAGQQLGSNDLNRAIEGQPIGVFFGPEFAGADPANGDAIYYRNTANQDGSIDRSTTNDYNQAERVVLGNPNPKWIGGLGNNFSFKGFDLNVLLQAVYGNQVYNGGGQYMSASASNGFDNQTVDQLNYWKNPGDVTNVPEVRQFFANGTNPSSRYLSDGSYLRFKTVVFGYNLPSALAGRARLQRVRLYVSAQNLFTITRYTGWDPEVNADYQASNINQGVDFYSAPQAKTITFGVNLGL